MPKPECVFLVTWLYDGDTPAGNRWVWTLEEAVQFVARLHDMSWVQVAECHPVKGRRKVLEYAPAGLSPREPGERFRDPWEVGYTSEFLKFLLDQPYPGPLRSPWGKG